MYNKIYSFFLVILILQTGCIEEKTSPLSISELVNDSLSIQGKKEYASTPYVTPGDRVYAVGLQNGSFSELGWHIKGEMGGIWNHPIKLMDGFEFLITENNRTLTLDKASKFINYPFANQFKYQFEKEKLAVNAV